MEESITPQTNSTQGVAPSGATGENPAAKGIPDGLTPAQIVSRLDSYIICTHKAMRLVAVTLRNRHRRIKPQYALR